MHVHPGKNRLGLSRTAAGIVANRLFTNKRVKAYVAKGQVAGFLATMIKCLPLV